MRSFIREFVAAFTGLWDRARLWLHGISRGERALIGLSYLYTVLFCVMLARNVAGFQLGPPVVELPPPRPREAPVAEVRTATREPIDFTLPAREIPPDFKKNAKRPAIGEGAASWSIDKLKFDPATDLVWVDDARVWWESDNDQGDTEEDHLMHWAMEEPFRRLVELVHAEGGRLKVQDIYRAEGVHAMNSLHKQGRGIDLTDFNLPLSRLAALAWAAGFDWVYYELKGGAHVHASVNTRHKRRLSPAWNPATLSSREP